MADIAMYDGLTFRNGKIFITVAGKLRMILDNDIIDPVNNAAGPSEYSNTCYWVFSKKSLGSFSRTFFRSYQLPHRTHSPSSKDTHSETLTKPFQSCGNFPAQINKEYNSNINEFSSSLWDTIETARNFYAIGGVFYNSKVYPAPHQNNIDCSPPTYRVENYVNDIYQQHFKNTGCKISKDQLSNGTQLSRQTSLTAIFPNFIRTGNSEDGYNNYFSMTKDIISSPDKSFYTNESFVSDFSIISSNGCVPGLLAGAICNPRCSIPAATDNGPQIASFNGGTIAAILNHNTIAISELLKGDISAVNFGFGPCLLRGLFLDKENLENFGKKASEYVDSCSDYFIGKETDPKKYFSISDPSQMYNAGDYIPMIGIYDPNNLTKEDKEKIMYLNGPCGENSIGMNSQLTDKIYEYSNLPISYLEWNKLYEYLKLLPPITQEVINSKFATDPTYIDPLMFSTGECTVLSGIDGNHGELLVDPSTGQYYIDENNNFTGEITSDKKLNNHLGSEDPYDPYDSPLAITPSQQVKPFLQKIILD